ncbi:MAG: alkaline phosphatase family protein [Arachidicoccus sp.]|nr:alkaline phosphatase family protein [Arachidicoccus sp.]
MKKVCLFFLSSIILLFSCHQKQSQLPRPKLVIGIVIDQMRWDYLYRYYDKYGNTGFKRLLKHGFSCSNTLINHLPSQTAVGHSTIFSGSIPSIDGIAGNDWIDQKTRQRIYCTDDSTVVSVGAASIDGKMSPRNLWVTTVTDELRLATNFQSKVIGVSLKDRASILPAGHTANGAFWFDDESAGFITSSYYMQKLPKWVNDFNKEKNVDKFLKDGWNTLYPIKDYTESTGDNESWEGMLKGAQKPTFSFNLKTAYAADKSSFRNTPFGNTLTLQFAKAAIEGEELGQRDATDFLTINCASTDYVGHMTGTNSIEIEDTYLRFDKDLGDFLSYLDSKVGTDNYLLFISADHGASQSEGFLQVNNIPSGLFDENSEFERYKINNALKQKFNTDSLAIGIDDDEVSFDERRIDSLKLDKQQIKQTAINFLEGQDGILYAVDEEHAATAPIPQRIRDMIINGYCKQRSGEVKIIFQANWLPDEYKTGTTHSAWNPYDTHIPLLFYGWKIPHGESNETVYMTDIAPTVAALLHIQMPSGCIGKPIVAITDKVNK